MADKSWIPENVMFREAIRNELSKPPADSVRKRMIPIPEGSLLMITAGEYSDYGAYGVFRAKVTIDADAIREQWMTDHPEQAKGYRFEEHAFIGWLIKTGHIEPVAYFDWYLGECGSTTEMEVTNSDD